MYFSCDSDHPQFSNKCLCVAGFSVSLGKSIPIMRNVSVIFLFHIRNPLGLDTIGPSALLSAYAPSAKMDYRAAGPWPDSSAADVVPGRIGIFGVLE